MKKRVLKRAGSTALGALMFICLPITSFARTIDVSTISTGENIDLSQETENVILTGTNHSGIYVSINVEGNTDRIVILQDLTLSSLSDSYPMFQVGGEGNAIIELDGINTLTAVKFAGLMLADEETILTIKDDNETPGSLEAIGGDGYPGIGVGSGKSGCNITIDGGTITATGGQGGAGIGSAYYSPATVTINGGTVTAISEAYGAGIGSGGGANAPGTVTINGGTVYAISKYVGAGIGGGCLSTGSSVTISNGATVYAAGGVPAMAWGNGVAIGEGGYDNGSPADGAEVLPDISDLYTTGSITTFAAGTTLDEIKQGTVSGVTAFGTKAAPEPETTNEETQKDNTSKEDPKKEQPAKKPAPEYTERSCIADVDVAALVATTLKADPNAKEVNIEFGDNICLTPDIMKDLFADNRVAKNCMFSHKGKRYVLRINAVDTKSKAYADGFAALKEEPDGLAGFLQMAKLFEALGVKVKELN